MLLTIDPGKHHNGCALWEDGEMVRAWLDGPLIDTQLPNGVITEIAIEIPVVYSRLKTALQDGGRSVGGKGKKKPVDPNDLVDLAFFGGINLGRMLAFHPGASSKRYKPAEWKGQVPKAVMNRRVVRRLTDEEHSRIERPGALSLEHNILDAVGIGLYHLKRLL